MTKGYCCDVCGQWIAGRPQDILYGNEGMTLRVDAVLSHGTHIDLCIDCLMRLVREIAGYQETQPCQK